MGTLNPNDTSTVPFYGDAAQPYAKAHIFRAGTDLRAPIYLDSDLTQTQSNPLVADSNGVFPLCHLVNGAYRVRILDRFGNVLVDADPVSVHAPQALGIVKGFTTVAEMLADKELSYEKAQGRSLVQPGHMVRAAQRGFVYTVLDADHPTPHLTTQGGIKLHLNGLADFEVAALGAEPNVDASAALQKALDVWVDQLTSGQASRLRISGKFSFTTPLRVEFLNNASVGGVIDMTGGRLLSNVAAGQGPALSFASRRTVRKINLVHLNLRGSGEEDALLEIDGGDAHEEDRGYFYGWNLITPTLEGFSTTGLWLHNNAFEATISNPYFACTSTDPGTYCMHCQDDTGGATSGNVSSIVLQGGVMRGGQHNLYCEDNADIRCYGTTFLEAGQEGIVERNMIGGCYVGIHIENPWKNGGTTPKAGIKVLNNSNLTNIYVLGNNGHVDTGATIYLSGGEAHVDNVITSSDLAYSLHIRNSVDTGGRILLTGIRRDQVIFNAPIGESMVNFPARQSILSQTSYGLEAVPIDVAQNNIFEVLCEADVVIADPVHMIRGDRITVILTQNGAGNHTVTWPANFRVLRAFDPTPSTATLWDFFWTGTQWLQSDGTGV